MTRILLFNITYFPLFLEGEGDEGEVEDFAEDYEEAAGHAPDIGGCTYKERDRAASYGHYHQSGYFIGFFGTALHGCGVDDGEDTAAMETDGTYADEVNYFILYEGQTEYLEKGTVLLSPPPF